MSITFISAGTVAQGTNSQTAVASTYSVGDALFLVTGEWQGSNTITTPSGWNKLSADSAAHQVQIFSRFAQSTSETIPAVNWGAANAGWAVVLAFRGVDSNFTQTFSGTRDRVGASTTGLFGPAGSSLPNQDGSLVIFAGTRNKTATADGATYSAPANFTMAAQRINNGASNVPASGVSYWIQTTATAVPANTSMTLSIPDSSTTSQGSLVFLAPAPPPSGGGGAGTVLFPPYKRKTYVFYDQYYPR